MHRALQIGAGLALALAILTCTDERVTGPARPGHLLLDVHALQTGAPGQPVIPFDSLRITLRRPTETAYAYDKTVPVRSDTVKGDSVVLRLDVQLQQTTEDFILDVTSFGAGIAWYTLTASVHLTAGATAAPSPFVARYVGPGHNAKTVRVFPVDTTAVGGTSFPLRSVVTDSSDGVIAGVPVGYLVRDATKGSITQTLVSATFTAAPAVRDSVWLVAETPTHLRDSTRIHIIPPAASLQKVSGDGQTAVLGAALKNPLVVRVLDALNGGFKGDTVRWTVTTANATLTAPFSVSDDTGYVLVSLTPSALGSVTVQAAVAGLSGSPQTFTVTSTAGTVRQVIISPKFDTIARGLTVQYTAVARDQFGNVVNTPFNWISTVQTIATINSSGLATALAGDSTFVIAGAGGYADTAKLYVRALRAVVVSPADTVVTAVNDSFQLTTTAKDNFGAVLTSGFTTRVISASPSVVVVNVVTGRIKSIGAGNGVLVVRDSVDPQLVVQGSAIVHVNQVTTGISTTPKLPDSLQVGVNGRGQIIAKALDGNGYPIPGKSFVWTSRLAGFATVDQSGTVSGVTLGRTYVTDSVDGRIDSALVAVVQAPPALLQWGFKSLAVGNGGSVSVPLTLSRTDPGPISVLLISSDTMVARAAIGCASPPGAALRKIQIPANTAATSVLLCGLTAGGVTLVAQDSAGVFRPDTMTVTVVSTIQFNEIGQFSRQTNFYVNQKETHRAQVFLSDPAPSGGLGVTFVYGRAGTSAVTPAPAIIPAGQLSANVTIQGLAPGTDSVVPTSGGFVGKFSYVAVAPDSLRMNVPYPYALGVGQTLQPYVSMTYAMDHPLLVSLSLAPVIGTVQDTVTIPTNSYSAYFTVKATAAGAATVTATAPGWVAGAGTITFTPPQLGASGTTSMVAGDPSRGSWYASTEDSILRYSHPVADTVVVTATSRDPTVVAVDSAIGKVVPGQGTVLVYNALRAQPAAGGRSAWIVLTSPPSYRPDSFLVSVMAPALTFAISYPSQALLGGRFSNAGYVSIPYVRPDSFTVVFTHTRRGFVSGPDSVTIPKGQTYAYFGIVGDSLGLDTINVSRAIGYTLPASLPFKVVPLHVAVSSQPTTLYTISRPQVVNVLVRQDSYPFYANALVAPLRVSLASSKPTAFALDSLAVTIPAGAYISNNDTLRVPPASPGNDSGRVLTRAPGSTNDSSSIIRVLPTPLTLYIPYPQQTAYHLKLQGGYVTIPDIAPDTVRINLTQLFPLKDSLSAVALKITPGNQSSNSFDIIGLDSTGTDTITAAATGYVASKARDSLVPAQINMQGIGANHLTTEPPYRVVTYVRMRPYPQYTQNARDTVRFTVVSTDSTVIQIDSAATVSPTAGSGTAFVAPGISYGYFRVRFAGSGTARIVVSAPAFGTDTMAPVTVSGPALHLGYQNLTVGVGQVFQNQYAYVDNAVTSAPLVITLQRSDSGLVTPAFALSTTTVTIPVGQSSSPSFNITGDTIGTAQLIARATGYAEARTLVSVGKPQLVVPKTQALFVGEVPRTITVSAEDQGNSIRVVATPLVVSQTSSDPAVAVGDFASRTIAAGQYATTFNFRGLKFGSVSTIFTAAGYKPDTMVVSVDTGQLSLVNPPNGLGPGQSATQMYVQLPYTTAAGLVVDLASDNPAVLPVPSTVTIPANNRNASFTVTGAGVGTANVTATATGVRPATAVPVRISTPKLQVFLVGSTIAGQQSTVTVYAEDSLGSAHILASPLTVSLASTNPTHAAFDSATIHIPAGSDYVSTGVVFDTAGPYTITATVPAGGYTSGNATATTTGALVRMVNTLFGPQTVTIKAQQYVTWQNNDPGVLHTASSDTPGQFDTGDISAGTTATVYFPTAGTYYYHCAHHGTAGNGTSFGTGMVGVVIVQ